MKTQGEKTQADHDQDWLQYGRTAWASGVAYDPSRFVTDERLAMMWRIGWMQADMENQQKLAGVKP